MMNASTRNHRLFRRKLAALVHPGGRHGAPLRRPLNRKLWLKSVPGPIRPVDRLGGWWPLVLIGNGWGWRIRPVGQMLRRGKRVSSKANRA